MKRIIYFLVFAVSQSLISHAQVTKESFVKAVDLLNCRSVELSLKNDKRIVEFNRECSCGKTSYDQINRFLDTADKLDATLKLSDEINKLKQKFHNNWNKEDAILFLSEEIYNDKTDLPRIFAFASKRKNKPDFDTFKAIMDTDLRNTLRENIPIHREPKEIVNENLSDRRGEIHKSEKYEYVKKADNGFFITFSDYFAIMASILSIAAIFIALSRPSAKRIYETITGRLISSKRMNEHFQQKDYHSFSSAVLHSDTSDMGVRILALERQVSVLNELIRKYDYADDQHERQPYSAADQVSISNPQPLHETIATEVRTETFFHASPNSDGSFEESLASLSFKEGATIYQFTKLNTTKASFKIVDRFSSIKIALQYRDRSIDPACESVNAFNQSKSLSTLEEGRAELQNGRWKVVKKARVRYEN